MKSFETNVACGVEQRERPKALYHASPVSDLEALKASNRTKRDKAEGPVVFATPDKAYATVYLFHHDSRWTSHGKIDGIPYILIAKEKQAFMRDDTGGTIYTLSPEGFDCDPNKGMGHDEWTHKGPVTPLKTERESSVLEAMLRNGVQVYFVDQATLRAFEQAIRDPEKDETDIIQDLHSENERQGINAVKF